MEAQVALKQYFGYGAFRPGQEALVSALLGGRDVLAVMPTGAGKSLCFQLPALLLPGITLVLSPLISLMRDQVVALNQSGIRAAYLNSTLTAAQYRSALQNAANGLYKILYVAPERLETESFLTFAQEADISLVAVDEAHCISQWGQDFRPSYLKIADFLASLRRRPPVGAFTATATARVREDVTARLGLQEPLTLVTGFDRPNLFLAVKRPKDRFGALLTFLESHSDESGIIYCATRKTVEQLHEKLRQKNYRVGRYHAGLSDEERTGSQEDFLFDRTELIVATNAFGMGIDKSNVRFVVHYNMPSNIESYYQEAGRAGRDGLPSDCLLLYSGQDVLTHKYMIDHKEGQFPDAETERSLKEGDLFRLEQMTRYCTTTACLRSQLLAYFGESAEPCGHCSSCAAERADRTVEAQKILSCVFRARERYGAGRIISTLRGERVAAVVGAGLDRLTTFGILNEDNAQLQLWIDGLVQQRFLCVESDPYPVLKLGPQANALLRGNCRVLLPQLPPDEKKTKKKRIRTREDYDPQLFDRLRVVRRSLAEEAGVPAFVILADSALIDMCYKLPQSDEAFLQVSGIGKAKLMRYGQAFMEAISAYLSAAEKT